MVPGCCTASLGPTSGTFNLLTKPETGFCASCHISYFHRFLFFSFLFPVFDLQPTTETFYSISTKIFHVKSSFIRPSVQIRILPTHAARTLRSAPPAALKHHNSFARACPSVLKHPSRGVIRDRCRTASGRHHCPATVTCSRPSLLTSPLSCATPPSPPRLCAKRR